MKRKKIVLVAGARPNFMKVAPLLRELAKIKEFQVVLVHTGQHYDYEMSKSFFEQLGIREPDYYLEVGSDTHSVQTAKIMIRFEQVCQKEWPDLVVVVGDVNSTLAASLVSVKLGIPIAHVEAGLRSFDRTMPEEINRVVTDILSEYLFTTCRDANHNLINEGIPQERIFFVGNVMIDTLVLLRDKAERRNVYGELGLERKGYALLTLHRPSNVDNRDSFKVLIQIINEVAQKIPIVFPVHPRTRKRIVEFGFKKYFGSNRSVKLINAIGYLDFLNLMMNAKVVLTDSGGIQEETTYLSIPCLTLRENTERSITVEEGTNTIVGNDKSKIMREIKRILKGMYKRGQIPELWDGKAAVRIVKVLKTKLL